MSLLRGHENALFARGCCSCCFGRHAAIASGASNHLQWAARARAPGSARIDAVDAGPFADTSEAVSAVVQSKRNAAPLYGAPPPRNGYGALGSQSDRGSVVLSTSHG